MKTLFLNISVFVFEARFIFLIINYLPPPPQAINLTVQYLITIESNKGKYSKHDKQILEKCDLNSAYKELFQTGFT